VQDIFKKLSRKIKKSRSLILTVIILSAAVFSFYHLSHAPKPAKHTKPAKHAVTIIPPAVRQPAQPAVRPAVEKPVFPPVKKLTKKPKIAFVIDDIGYNKTYRDLLAALGNKVTYAILPQLPFSTAYSKLSLRTGAKVILHQPLEAIDGSFPGPGLIKRNMSEQEMTDILSRNIKTVPNLIGVNNHMGSAGTSDRHTMNVLLRDLKSRHLFFLDSRTSLQSVAPEIAAQVQIPFLKRDVFLDNVETDSSVKEMIRKTAEAASIQGYAVAIGHYKEVTLRLLAEEIPKLERQGYEIVLLPDLLN
jgi:polysaccharide deacetylase 2 family uncharacterized protein YibQ